NTEKHAKNTWLNRLADFFGFGARRRRNSPHKIAYLSAKKLYAQVLEQAKAGQGINALLLEQYSKNLRKAVAGVMDSANFGDQYFALQQQFQANVSQFAAHKAWCAAQQIEAARFDKDGNPRSDEAWQRQATAILDRFDAYQNAEFNTATARARTAKQWTDFNEKENKILFPNLRWLPSRSADPRPEHAKFYGLTLPKDHPFWRTNQPGNLYNCKCDWEETFDSADSVAPQNDSAAVGLEGNPAETKEIFTRNAAWFKFSQNRENEYEKNILELKNDGFYPKEVRNIPVNVSILHNTGEVAGNLEVLHSYLNGKNDIAKISLLPNISEKNMSMKKDFYPEGQLPRNIKKNADALIEFKNGKQIVADFKAMQGNGVNLRRRLKDSYEQADRAIIKIKGTPDVREITETADSFMNQHFRFKELLIYDSRETLIYERKKDI
ncbi:MAG: phage head morphogenesis protein, partial [Prevotellaceae bacterium]|nr:phage head morphogenesis protein [Prevotellaceae bacterium]